jgi:hypothetical protein
MNKKQSTRFHQYFMNLKNTVLHSQHLNSSSRVSSDIKYCLCSMLHLTMINPELVKGNKYIEKIARTFGNAML